MARFTVRATLSNAVFPFATELWGRSIIVPGQDMNYDRAQLNLSGQVLDKGIPQAYYMENVIPTVQGYQSVFFRKEGSAYSGGTKSIGRVFPIHTNDGGRYLFSPAEGKNYIYDAAIDDWRSVSPIAPGTLQDNALVTTAHINGQTYIFYEGYDAFVYDNAGFALTSVTLSALVIANITGLCAANGQMLAWSGTTLYWSSLTDETDFTPDLTTGAGSASVQEAKGRILLVLPTSNGVFLYCTGNVVYGKYTGNEQFPYSYHEVPGSGFISNASQVSWHSNMSYQIAQTSNGIQQFDGQTSSNIYNDITDFLSLMLYEEYNASTQAFVAEYLSTPLFTAIAVVQARFFVLSYGKEPNRFTDALIYDLNLKRYGKLKLNHVACFEWNFPTIQTAPTYEQLMNTTYADLMTTTYDDLDAAYSPNVTQKGGVAFVTENGLLYVMDTSQGAIPATALESSSRLVIGKFQMDRLGGIEHHITEVESVDSNSDFTCKIIPSYDGKTLLTPRTTFEQSPAAKLRRFSRHVTGENISCFFEGRFNLNTLLITYTRRNA
jgi:hypothetical protein